MTPVVGYTEMRDSGIKGIGEIPAIWKVSRVHNLFFEVSDRYTELKDDQLPLLAVSEYYGVAERAEKIDADTVLVRAETLEGYKKCKKGDIVSNIMLAWKSALGQSPMDGIVSPAYCVYRPREGVNSKYYHYLFRTKRYADIFRVNSTGLIDSRLRLYSPKFFVLQIPVPSYEEQSAIAAYLDTQCAKIDEIIAEAKASIEDYQQWKASIIYEAVTKGLDPDVEMKDSGIEWVAKIPARWHKGRVSQVANAYNGDRSSNYPSGGDIVSSGISFLTSNNLGQIKLNTDIQTNKFITSEKYHSLRGAKLQKDDIVFCLRGSVGKCSINKTLTEGSIASSLILIRPVGINPDYLNYVLQNSAITETAVISAIGIGSLNLSAENIMSFSIPLPSLDEQKRIAQYLDETCSYLDDIVLEKQLLIADLESYKKSLIYEVVTGKRRVRGWV